MEIESNNHLFTSSSVDYRALKGLSHWGGTETNADGLPAMTFETLDQTEIPELQKHCFDAHRVNGIRFLNSFVADSLERSNNLYMQIQHSDPDTVKKEVQELWTSHYCELNMELGDLISDRTQPLEQALSSLITKLSCSPENIADDSIFSRGTQTSSNCKSGFGTSEAYFSDR
jgi:hypothetical protein